MLRKQLSRSLFTGNVFEQCFLIPDKCGG